MQGVILNDLKNARHLNKDFWLKRLSFLTRALRQMDSNPQHFRNGTKVVALELESVKLEIKPLVVSILGTGDFGRALGQKILETCSRSAVKVIFGSRNPQREEIRVVGQDQPAETFSHEEAILKSGWLLFIQGHCLCCWVRSGWPAIDPCLLILHAMHLMPYLKKNDQKVSSWKDFSMLHHSPSDALHHHSDNLIRFHKRDKMSPTWTKF